MKYQIIALAVLTLAFVSCGKKNTDMPPDGIWDPMELSATEIIIPNGKDSTFTITCSNYSSIWICEGTYKMVDDGDTTTVWQQTLHNIGKIQGSWYEIWESGNTVTGHITKNDKTTPRGLIFDIQAGDAFQSIVVRQE